MDRQRRTFVWMCLSVVSPSLSGLSLLEPQHPSSGVRPPEPAQPLSVIVGPENRTSRTPLERDRGQQFRRCLEQLCDCANGLRNTASEVNFGLTFPVEVYKRTQLLERLAKQLRVLAKT
jgi:hypothetical protein